MVTTLRIIIPRCADEPVPDLTKHALLHRAMTVDMRRLAETAGQIALRPHRIAPRRVAALRDYLAGVIAEIRSHHQLEDNAAWPMVRAAAGPQATALAALTEGHRQLDPLLDAATELASRLALSPADRMIAIGLTATLRELSELLNRHVADEEREVFPLIRAHVRIEDHAWLQQQFRRNLSVRTVPFMMPWAVHHATEEELPQILAAAEWPLRLQLRISWRRFATRERLVFG
jgi:iron-sulfur cluster repair protein YtfE (RIC family)